MMRKLINELSLFFANLKNSFSEILGLKKNEDLLIPSKVSSTVVYLVRHGQTDWNLAKKWQGQTDITLNQTGQNQAEEVAAKLREVSLTKCFSSDLLRAYETALILKGDREIPISMDKRLRERNFGEFEGVSYDDFHSTPEEKRKRIESDEQMRVRALIFLKEVSDSFPNDTILIVTHSEVIKSLLVGLLHLNTPISKIQMQNTALLKIHCDHGEWKIDELQGIELPKQE